MLSFVLGINVKLSFSSFQWYLRYDDSYLTLEDTVVHTHALFLTPHAWHAYH